MNDPCAGNDAPFNSSLLYTQPKAMQHISEGAVLAGIVDKFAAAVLIQHSSDLQHSIPGPPDPCWLYDLVLRQLLASACRWATSSPSAPDSLDPSSCRPCGKCASVWTCQSIVIQQTRSQNQVHSILCACKSTRGTMKQLASPQYIVTIM